jgi:hypothetical protein
MESLSPIASLALTATVLLLLTVLLLRMRKRSNLRRRSAREAVDTLVGWPPESVRVLSIVERQAYELLRQAMPGFLVLAQVPLARFVRVPARRSYAEWLSRVGSLSADLLLCDAGSRVLAVIDVRPTQESDRARRRHERMGRVLRGAGIQVYVWREGALPSASEARTTLAALVGPVAKGIKPTASRPMPLVPQPDISEVLADGDRGALDGDLSMEPVPSAFMEDYDTVAEPR